MDLAQVMYKKGADAGEKRYSWMTLLLFWCGLVIVSSNYLTIPLLSMFSNEFGTTVAQAAWTGSVFSLFYAVGSLFSGPLSDRLGRKQVILVGLLALAGMTLLIGLVNSLASLIMLRSIQGLAAATFAPVAIAYVVDKFPPQRIVTTIGFVSSGFLMSGVLGQLLSGFLSHQFGWRSVFYYFGGIYAATAIFVVLVLPKGSKLVQAGSLIGMFGQFKRVLSQKSLRRCYFITVTLLLSFVGMYTTLGDYLTIEFGLSEQGILATRAFGIVGMLFAPFAGKFAVWFGLQRVLRGGLALAMSSLAIVGVVSDLNLLVGVTMLFVLGIAITVPTLISLVGEFGGQDHGAAVSLYAFVLFVGTSLGPLVTMALLRTGSFVLAFAGLAVLLGLSLAVSFKVEPPVAPAGEER